MLKYLLDNIFYLRKYAGKEDLSEILFLFTFELY